MTFFFSRGLWPQGFAFEACLFVVGQFAQGQAAVDAVRFEVHQDAFDETGQFVLDVHDLAHPQRPVRFGALVKAFDDVAPARPVHEGFQMVPDQRAVERGVKRAAYFASLMRKYAGAATSSTSMMKTCGSTAASFIGSKSALDLQDRR